MKKERFAVYFTMILAAGCFIASVLARPGMDTEPEKVEISHLHCAISMKPVRDTTRRLITGYNYKLLELFAQSDSLGCEIWLVDSEEEALDSLMSKAFDIIVLPYRDSLLEKHPSGDSLAVSSPIDSTTVWVMRKDSPLNDGRASRWMESHLYSAEDSLDRARFFNVYAPAKARPRKSLSPYDDIIKAYADTLGWDWRMLAALIYEESHFHMEAVSPRGAEGLMQLVPHTSKVYGVDNPFNPEQNIAGGVKLLMRLTRRYEGIGDNMTERFKYTLAAFNAGVGRIEDCINYALYRGRNPSYWINVEAVIPEMNDDSIMETGVVKFGKFSGIETIAYVEQVVATYNEFLRICPDKTAKIFEYEKDNIIYDHGHDDDGGMPAGNADHESD